MARRKKPTAQPSLTDFGHDEAKRKNNPWTAAGCIDTCPIRRALAAGLSALSIGL